MVGDDSQWGLAEHLLAVLADVERLAIYQRGGGKGEKPKPIPRPGLGPDRDEKRIGGGDVVRTPAEIDALFAELATPEEVTDGS